jgi:hypothetical protein
MARIKWVWTLFIEYFKNLNEIDEDLNNDRDMDFDTIPPENFSTILNSPVYGRRNINCCEKP